MRFFDALVSPMVRKDERGRYIVCPWGVLGPAWLLRDRRQFEVLRATTLLWLAAVLLVPFWLEPGAQGLAFVAASSGVYGVVLLWQIRGLERAAPGASRRFVDPGVAPWVRALFVVGAILMATLGLSLALFDPAHRVEGVVGFAFFGLCAFMGFRYFKSWRPPEPGGPEA